MATIIGPIWTKRGRLEGGLDPLGLDRPSDRLTAELIPGVSVNVNLARYFSFLPWLFLNSEIKDEDDLAEEIVRAEKVYALSAALVHNGERCSTGIAGSDLIRDRWDFTGQVNLDKVPWLTNGGVYLGYYKGPLYKLGLLTTDANRHVMLTPEGRSLAAEFGRSASGTAWAQRRGERKLVSRAALEEFGKKACPCSLADAPSEKRALRRLFFDTSTLEGKMLSQTLGLALSVVEQCGAKLPGRLEQAFRLSVYYRHYYNEQGRPVSFRVRTALDSIVDGWRMFQAHDYFSFALETLLSVWLGDMRDQPNQRLTLEESLNHIDGRQFVKSVNRRLKSRIGASSLAEISIDQIVKELLGAVGFTELTARSSQAFDRKFGLAHYLAEEGIVDDIWALREQGGQMAARFAETIILLMVLYVRFYQYHLNLHASPNWERYAAASSQSETDLGLPGFYWDFQPESLARLSIPAFFEHVIAHYVIERVLAIREERGRDLVWFSEAGLAGLGVLSRSKQLYQYHFDFEGYTFYRNTSKLSNALLLLKDIDYVTRENDDRWTLTPEGRRQLEDLFGE